MAEAFPSPRKRRCLFRESVDNEGDMGIEQCLYRTDPFRSISFLNPDPTALNFTTIAAEEDPTQHLHRDISNTLDEYGLPAESLFRY
ncbi:hypothetical protein N7537_005798 [Penicillium hordei]|uniref:Uncharacterized protein n=1 Tax=Penicillium hordei TaxID=40994 RepID=A0AAD6E7L1_9EURO|nr:uncharacterized protein N7537_005798 [Penicillium hordei]KAJ5602842.1 hypothetical protein N7537_005798 [Penicillium hordei]